MGLGTAATIATVGIKVAGAVGSFRAATQVDDLLEKANKDAAEYLNNARSRIEKDFYAGLNVPTAAFEDELLTNLQATTTAVEALSEAGSRELLGGVGKIQAVQQAGAEKARAKQEEELFALEKLKAENRDAMNQQMLQLEVAAEQDRVKRERDAQEDRATLMTQGFTQLGDAATTALSQQNLYRKSADDRKLEKFLKKNNITTSQYAADPDKYAEDFRIFKLSDKEFDAEIEADLEKQQGESAVANFYDSEEGQRLRAKKRGAEADMEFRRKQNEDLMAAVASLTPQMGGQVSRGPSPLMQNLFPSFEETMAKYGIALPQNPKLYTTIN